MPNETTSGFVGCSPTPQSHALRPIVLTVQGMGHVPSFKNRKRIRVGKNGKPVSFTQKEVKAKMSAIIQRFELKLLSAFRIAAAETSTELSLPSWIASSLPADDCWTEVPKIHLEAVLCDKGEEGATITIEPA